MAATIHRVLTKELTSGIEVTPASEGAQEGARPVVPCAQLTIGKPPAGGVPPGSTTIPDTATSAPASVSEW